MEIVYGKDVSLFFYSFGDHRFLELLAAPHAADFRQKYPAHPSFLSKDRGGKCRAQLWASFAVKKDKLIHKTLA